MSSTHASLWSLYSDVLSIQILQLVQTDLILAICLVFFVKGTLSPNILGHMQCRTMSSHSSGNIA